MIQDISRRALMGVGGALLLPAGFAVAQEGRVVETTEGRYRGLLVNGVHVFKGMRYGASTEGAGRFMPPKPPEKFAGVQDAFDYGHQTPQQKGGLAGPQPMSGDCLRINVWSPALDNKKRPVLLWFHGGGFESGSGGSPMYDGTNMVKRGDVVTCTINSRLNVFGFCDLSSFLGQEFAQSGNAGYLDLVRSMQWVKDNIAQFGGDPSNIMIYGQSGGGRKVTVCYAGKEAAGLFAKGVVQSGSHNIIQTKDQAARLTTDLLKALSIDPKNARALQQVPQETLTEVQRKVIGAAGYRFEPVMDGIAFTANPFIPNAPQRTAKVPLMLGTAKTELSNQLGNDPAVHQIDEAGLRQRVAGILPAADVDEAVKLFKTTTPSGSYPEMFFKIASWRSYIRNATIMAEKRDALNGGDNKTWMYQVTWRSPVEGGRRYSQHSSDLPFMFDNCDKPVAARYIGTQTEATKVMSDSMANAWLAFARTGNPNHSGIPNWPTYNARTRSVMEFEAPPKLVNDPYSSERKFFERYQPSRTTSSD